MSLTKYNEKRHFSKTPEPKGSITKKSSKLIFVVQRHKASHLHYDFRLEVDSVLKSWAIPKGPSLYPADKRLAMMVEDHPVSYATFEGTIPEGNYGAGIVEIWDNGTYELSSENKGNSAEAIENGSLKVVLHGKKLKGQFALIKLKNAEANAWLLIKDKDEYATDEPYNSEDHTAANSAIDKALLKKDKPTLQPAKNKKTAALKKASASKKKRTFIMP